MKILFGLLSTFLLISIFFARHSLASHSSQNIVVNDLAIFAISTTEAHWTPTGSTAGVIFIGTTNDPIHSSIRSVSVSTSAGTANLGNLTAGSYFAAMYTGAFGEVRMSNVASFNVGSSGSPGGGSGGSSGQVECTNFVNCVKDGITNPSNRQSDTFIGKLITDILPLAIAFGGFIAIIMIVISGIQLVTSSGDPNAAGQARGRLTFALIGFALLALAYMITRLIDNVFLRNSGIFG